MMAAPPFERTIVDLFPRKTDERTIGSIFSQVETHISSCLDKVLVASRLGDEQLREAQLFFTGNPIPSLKKRRNGKNVLLAKVARGLCSPSHHPLVLPGRASSREKETRFKCHRELALNSRLASPCQNWNRLKRLANSSQPCPPSLPLSV